MKTNRTAILQPHVPHYRTAFFRGVDARMAAEGGGGSTVYCYSKQNRVAGAGFRTDMDEARQLAAWEWHGIVWYNPFPLLRGHDTLVLMLHFAHLTTWLLLLTRWLHRRKIVLWGQGISVKRYLREAQKPDWKLRCMMRLANGAWIYMPREAEQWQGVFPRMPIVALKNTVSGVEAMADYRPAESRGELRRRYGIAPDARVLLFCARFENAYRRTDLLEAAIRRLQGAGFEFVIIGGGRLKPDFSPYGHVHDFGAVYDDNAKRDLFSLADAYFQPGWVGLSIVEAMAYGLPVLTFRRSESVKQCVEYGYIREGENGLLFDDMDHCIETLKNTPSETLHRMGANARQLVAEELTIDQMTERACSVLHKI